jgi:hypothetical protein
MFTALTARKWENLTSAMPFSVLKLRIRCYLRRFVTSLLRSGLVPIKLEAAPKFEVVAQSHFARKERVGLAKVQHEHLT